ncbi:MAG TPA: ThiF family adenylyltransferase [Candidatus Bathyarchaeia archaeon]|nr:ThiF family adenylyltransferase [Candidatus Bathyarchaeia archaeon]
MTKLFKIIFPGKLFDEMIRHLRSSRDKESGCYLLAHRYAGRGDIMVATIVGIIKPETGSWERQGEHTLRPTSAFINQAAVAAEREGCGLFFVHTHPNLDHPPTFSPIDEETNSRLLPNLAEILPGAPIGSLVLSGAGLYGEILQQNKLRPITIAKVNGRTTSTLDVPGIKGFAGSSSERVDRQVRALGNKVQIQIAQSTAVIVGAGGTGSAVATQLARMGIKKLILIDMDSIDQSNLSRVYGANQKDVGKSKVRVLKKYLESFSNTEVEAVVADVTKEDVTKTIAESDVIFGCTDNLTSRALMNDVALQYYIPLVDIGCRIHLYEHRAIRQAVVKVQVVTPDDACLWCTGTLEGMAILQESMSPAEKRRLVSEGYYEPAEKQPSVISITSLAGSVGVNKFLALLGVFGDDYPTRTQIELKSEFMISDSPNIRQDCVCHARRGMGDSRRIAFPKTKALKTIGPDA